MDMGSYLGQPEMETEMWHQLYNPHQSTILIFIYTWNLNSTVNGLNNLKKKMKKICRIIK